ncbi:hypothetical protein ACU686_41085 [Yinghuangia aomiensis]
MGALAGVLSAAGAWSAAGAATALPSLDTAARITVSPQQADIGTTLEIRGTGMRGCPDGSIDVFLLWHPDGGNMGDYRYLLGAGLPMNDANGYSFTLRHKVTEQQVDSNQVQAVCHAADRKASAGVPVVAPVEMTGRARATGRPSPAPLAPPANLPANSATAVPSSGLPGSTFVVWIKASCPRSDDMASLRNSMWAAWDETDLLPDDAPSTATGTDGIDRAIRLQVPVSGTRGPHKITVPCVSGHDTRELTTTFTVTPTELAVTPRNPAPGGRFHATGKYFTGCADAGAGRTGEIALALGSREIGRTQVAADGSFDADLLLPADATGNVPLTAACTIDHFDGTAQAALTLAAAATPVTPHSQGAPLAPGRSASAAQLPQPADVFHHPGTVAAAAAGSTIAIAVVGAGAEIVNRTIEEQRERIRRFFRPGGRAPRRHPRFPKLHVLAFVLLSALFALVADPGLDFDRGTLTLGLAMVVAVPLAVLTYSAGAEGIPAPGERNTGGAVTGVGRTRHRRAARGGVPARGPDTGIRLRTGPGVHRPRSTGADPGAGRTRGRDRRAAPRAADRRGVGRTDPRARGGERRRAPRLLARLRRGRPDADVRRRRGGPGLRPTAGAGPGRRLCCGAGARPRGWRSTPRRHSCSSWS